MNNREFTDTMKARTEAFALRVIKAVESLPNEPACWDMGRQLLRAATSVVANYRAACRARSPAEFVAKLGNVEEEADETLLWMRLLIGAGYIKPARLAALQTEATEILQIIVTSIKSSRQNALTAAQQRRRARNSTSAIESSTP